jgi:diguanylate cyclase (GGDEF)-like protein
MDVASFLCRDDAERRRMADVVRLLRPGTPYLLGFFALAGLSGVGTYGWLPLLPAAFSLLLFASIWQVNVSRHHRPEYIWAGLFLFAELMLAVAVALGRGPRGFSLVVMSMPVLLAALVFPRRVVLLSTVIGMALTSGLLFGVDLSEVRQSPGVALCALLVMVVLATTALVIRDLDEASRRLAFVDELTGALNRSALTPKLAEVTEQSRLTGEPIAVIIADIDRYKGINDEHGHIAGDWVLREVARRLGECVGAFEPVYRLGGEEFVMLLPGLGVTAAQEVATRMWQAIRHRPIEGVAVTMSFGVAVSDGDEPFDFDSVFARADQALYAAKHAGRDRVHVSIRPQTQSVASEHHAGANGGLQERRSGTPRRRATPGGGRRMGRAATTTAGLVSVSATTGSGHGAGGGEATAAVATPARAVGKELEREYVIDLNRRLGLLFGVIALAAFVAIATQIPEFGWAVLIPPVIGAVPYYLLSDFADRVRSPNLAIGAGWVILQTSIAAGFMLASGAPLFALSLLVLIVPGRCAVLRTRAAAAGTVYTALLMVAVAFTLDSSRVLGNPALLLFPLALLFSAGYVGAVVGGSAVGFRGASTVDALTGLLNRHALGSRLTELEVSAQGAQRTVAVILGDLDHFKQVNDTAGHAAGDAVLRAAAERIAAALRTFQRAYRVGGEEFLVLLPDADADAAQRVAERLRQVIAAEPCAGQDVTISLGVAVNPGGTRFVYGDVLARADAALYEAKRGGRDRVCVEPEAGVPQRAIAAGADA